MTVTIEDTKGTKHPIDLEEGDRQLIILSLALCSLLRPGFTYATCEIAKKLHGGSSEMFDAFRKYNTPPRDAADREAFPIASDEPS